MGPSKPDNEVGNMRVTKEFWKWIEENLKMPYGYYDKKAVLAELDRQVGNSGMREYEIRSTEAKDGKPHTYSF